MQAIRDDQWKMVADQQEQIADQTAWENERIWACCQVSPRIEHDQQNCHDYDCDHDSDLSPTSEWNGNYDQIAEMLGKLMRRHKFETVQQPTL